MAPDQISAAGSIAAAVIALLALGVSVYAAVVARRAAKASDRQADIADKSYRLSATPRLKVSLEGTNYPGTGRFHFTYRILREGGPAIMYYRFSDTRTIVTDQGNEQHKEDKGLEQDHWKMIYDGDQKSHTGMYTINKDEIVSLMVLWIEVELAESDSEVAPEGTLKKLVELAWEPKEDVEPA